jgi:hypothetical protein
MAQTLPMKICIGSGKFNVLMGQTGWRVPRDILGRANKIWQEEHQNSFYGYSYMARDPKTWADQQIGLIIAGGLSNHILRAHHKIKNKPPKICPPDCRCGSNSSEGCDVCHSVIPASDDDLLFDHSDRFDHTFFALDNCEESSDEILLHNTNSLIFPDR